MTSSTSRKWRTIRATVTLQTLSRYDSIKAKKFLFAGPIGRGDLANGGVALLQRLSERGLGGEGELPADGAPLSFNLQDIGTPRRQLSIECYPLYRASETA